MALRKLLCSVFALAPTLLAAQASQLIVCDIQGGESFEIELGENSAFGPLNCFYAPGIHDMTPCAPDGGWGLSYPTGMASLADVSTHYMSIRHYGGMLWSSVQPSHIYAAAAFGERAPLGTEITQDTFWSIEIDRTTGAALIRTKEGQMSAQCRSVARQF